MKKMKKIETRSEFDTRIATQKTVAMFSADWCGDCRYIEPHLPAIEAAHPDFNFIHIDRDQLLDLCQELAIFGIPSFVIFENGVELDRFVSKDRKTEVEITAFINASRLKGQIK